MKPKSTAGRNTAVQVMIVFYAVNTRCCQSSVRSKYALVSAPADCCGREIHYEENIYSSILLHSSFTYFFRQARPGSNQGGVLRAYLLDIQGVDPDEEYQDPNSFYFDIARKVGIAQVARDAVGKEFGRKQNDKRFFM